MRGSTLAPETLEIRTRDGVSLSATVLERAPGTVSRGTAVLAHALFARRSEFVRRGEGKGLAGLLAARGWRAIAFDFRGHGGSGRSAARGGTWSYEDLVVHDLPAVVEAARFRAEGRKVVVVGHSLGGHVALASQGTGRLEADAIVGFAAAPWLPEFETSRHLRAVRAAATLGMDTVAARRGYFPARVLRLGSDDECTTVMSAVGRMARQGRWESEDGREDYRAALARVSVPVLSVASDGDRICPPGLAERFGRAVGGRSDFDLVRRADDGRAPPGHAALLTTETARAAWERAEAWMHAA